MIRETRENIKGILRSCVSRAIIRTSKKIDQGKAHKPFHIALLTEDIVKMSLFERSFSTSFGQGPMESISELVARTNGFTTERQKTSLINIYKGAVDEVERICSALRGGNQKPNWEKEVETVSAFNRGDTLVRRVISDLWLEKDGTEYFISIKTVSPNLDQSEIAKKDMLLLKAENPKCETFFGLYYNPNGSSKNEYSHSPPMKIFNMREDKCVLIGKEYWDFLGGPGAYEELLEIFNEVGEETREDLASF